MDGTDKTYWLVRPGEPPRIVEETDPRDDHRRRRIFYNKHFVWIFAMVMDCATGELLPVREGIDVLVQMFL